MVVEPTPCRSKLAMLLPHSGDASIDSIEKQVAPLSRRILVLTMLGCGSWCLASSQATMSK